MSTQISIIGVNGKDWVAKVIAVSNDGSVLIEDPVEVGYVPQGKEIGISLIPFPPIVTQLSTSKQIRVRPNYGPEPANAEITKGYLSAISGIEIVGSLPDKPGNNGKIII